MLGGPRGSYYFSNPVEDYTWLFTWILFLKEAEQTDENGWLCVGEHP